MSELITLPPSVLLQRAKRSLPCALPGAGCLCRACLTPLPLTTNCPEQLCSSCHKQRAAVSQAASQSLSGGTQSAVWDGLGLGYTAVGVGWGFQSPSECTQPWPVPLCLSQLIAPLLFPWAFRVSFTSNFAAFLCLAGNFSQLLMLAELGPLCPSLPLLPSVASSGPSKLAARANTRRLLFPPWRFLCGHRCPFCLILSIPRIPPSGSIFKTWSPTVPVLEGDIQTFLFETRSLKTTFNANNLWF